jgi:hypothetical protein
VRIIVNTSNFTREIGVVLVALLILFALNFLYTTHREHVRWVEVHEEVAEHVFLGNEWKCRADAPTITRACFYADALFEQLQYSTAVGAKRPLEILSEGMERFSLRFGVMGANGYIGTLAPDSLESVLYEKAYAMRSMLLRIAKLRYDGSHVNVGQYEEVKAVLKELETMRVSLAGFAPE